MDRIFLNVKTGKIILSVKNGLMYDNEKWKQIGVVDTSFLKKKRGFKGLVKIS